jgi:hypothetical protein
MRSRSSKRCKVQEGQQGNLAPCRLIHQRFWVAVNESILYIVKTSLFDRKRNPFSMISIFLDLSQIVFTQKIDTEK